MKKNLFAASAFLCLLVACTGTKKTATTMQQDSKLEGTWELNYVSAPGVTFDSLYRGKKPVITFNTINKTVSGNTGCNNFNGQLDVEGNKINFTGAMAMTKMMCPGEGERVFIETLKKINTWAVSNDSTLNLLTGDIAVMRFEKQ